MCVNVHEWFLSLMVPNNKPYVNTGIDSRRWTMLCACVIGMSTGVNVQEWFLSPMVPNNKPYVHAYMHTLDIYQNTAVCRTFLTSLVASMS